MVLMGTYRVPSMQYLDTACPYLPRHPVGALADVGGLNVAETRVPFSRQLTIDCSVHVQNPGRQGVSTTRLRTLHVLTDTDGDQRLMSCLTRFTCTSAQHRKHHRRNVR
jgi:hypothetical protein